MKKLASIALSLLLPVLVISQQTQRVLIIEGETVLNDILAFETQYLSESFQEGSVFYMNGTRSTGKLNYNLLVDEIHFIDQNNEIRALANPKDITHITLGNRVFRYTPKVGYAEEIVSNKAKLLLKRKVNVITETRYTGAYGTTTHSTNVRPVDNFNLFRGTSHRFDSEGTETARINYSEGFFLEFRGKIHPFNKVNDAEKAVGKRNAKKLNEYLRSEGVNFKDLKNLENVVSWISNNI